MSRSCEIGPIRPPSEAQSLLIRVTRNCPWNRCTFCHTYKGEKFSFRTLEEIKKDIDAVCQTVDEIRQISWRMGYGGDLHPTLLRAVLAQGILDGPHGYNVLNWLYHGGTQVFLQDANSLQVKTSIFIEILQYLKGKFPSIDRITT